MDKSYIAIDWGSTNLRAWLYLHGQCVDTLRSEAGVTRFNGQSAQQVFQQVIAPWRDQQQQHSLPVVMAGMIGSNAGWISVPYLSCPTHLTQVSHQLTAVAEAEPVRAWIIPGLCVDKPDNRNVMRGEETQLIGAYAELPSSVYLMPGTHSKWVQMQGDQVMDFRTMMTGELHHLLLNNSLVGAGLAEQLPDSATFTQGLAQGFNDSNIMRCLFETRAAHVLGRLKRNSVSEWLSGLLIGNEVAQMQQQYPLAAGERITVIGNPKLVARYTQALEMAVMPYQVLDGDHAFQSGIRSIVNEMEY